MESGLFAILSDLVQSGSITDTSLLLIIIALMGLCYVYVLKPMIGSLDKTVSVSNVEDIISKSSTDHQYELEEVSDRLDKLIETLDEIGQHSKDSIRDIKEIRQDVQNIKQILNQFQGHFMYNNPGHFGNRELR